MFNYEELDAMAAAAQRELESQNNVGPKEDLYKDILSEDFEAPALQHEENYMTDDNEIDYDKLFGIKNSADEYEEVPTLNPYDEPLFPGGPTKSEIEAWKKDWDGYDIYITEILNQTFIFRTLNRYEYKQLVSLREADSLQREEVVCQTVTLWPHNYTWKEMATTLAGIPSTYAEIIMEKSGFTKEYAIQVI